LQPLPAHTTTTLKPLACACLAALAMAVAAGWWIETSSTLDSYAARAYYLASLHNGLQPRSLLGTAAQFLALTPAGFVLMLHAFKMLWLWLICWQLLRQTAPLAVSLWLCALFGFNFPLWITQHHGGFVDIAMHAWFVAAASLALPMKDGAPCPWKRMTALFALALLTHELAVFGIAIIMLWLWLGLERREIRLGIASLVLCCVYFALTWRQAVYGYSAGDYTAFLLAPHPISLYGLFTAGGGLWLLYALITHMACRQRTGRARTRYVAFAVCALLLCLLPAALGGDTQRMCCIIWLPLLLMVTQQQTAILANAPRLLRILPVFFVLQCAIPPGFTFGTSIHPMNCYGLRTLPFLLEALHSDLQVARYVRFRSACESPD
jgi:hypothetical protein